MASGWTDDFKILCKQNYFSIGNRSHHRPVHGVLTVLAILLRVVPITLNRVTSQESVKVQRTVPSRHYRLQCPIPMKLREELGVFVKLQQNELAERFNGGRQPPYFHS